MNVGAKVAVLDDVIEGKVIKTTSQEACIITSDGLKMWFPKCQLVVLGSDLLQVKVPKSKEHLTQYKDSNNKSKPNLGNTNWVIDLHWELLSKTRGTSHSGSILECQIQAATQFLNKANSKKASRVVFIHGIGNGILKKALYRLCKDFGFKEVYDADYKKYGQGATEVNIKSKV